jgi:hypothetical protein
MELNEYRFLSRAHVKGVLDALARGSGEILDEEEVRAALLWANRARMTALTFEAVQDGSLSISIRDDGTPAFSETRIGSFCTSRFTLPSRLPRAVASRPSIKRRAGDAPSKKPRR